MLIEVKETKCQYCIERQLDPELSIGLYEGLPICDRCLGPMLDNKSNIPLDVKSDKLTLEERKKYAIELLDRFEEIFEEWPLTADETLKCHEDFYCHRPPALINCDLKTIEEIYSRRKGILFAVRHKDERWANDIDRLKRELREKANLTGIQTSIKEKGRITKPSATKMKQLESIAKAMGVSIEVVLQMGTKAKQEEFLDLVGTKQLTLDEESLKITTSGILSNLKKKTEVKTEKLKINPFTGKPY